MSAASLPLLPARLRRRLRTGGAEPLLTYYEPAAGVRVELSAVTVANWVDKISNLLVEELLLEPGDVVELDLARAAPGHWVTACWQLACWQVGATVSVGSGLAARLWVVGPTWPDPLPAVDLVACSLHPLGLGLTGAVPPGVLDFATEVRGQPDSFAVSPVPGLALAWADPERQVNQADLGHGCSDQPRRRLVRPAGPWQTALDGLITALVSGGSVVVVTEADPATLERIATDERVT